MRGLLMAAAASAAVALGGAAQAATVTFNAEPDNFGTSVLAEGFEIAFTAAGWCLCDDVGANPFTSNGTKRLLATGGLGNQAITLSLVGGGLFSVSGFDAATAYLGSTNNLTVTGAYEDATTTTATFDLTDVHTSFSLSAAFDNIVSLTFAGNGGVFGEPGLSIDNLVVNGSTTAVPEPAAWAIMLAGFFGTGAAMRRRRALAAA